MSLPIVRERVDLAPYTTLRLPGKARFMADVHDQNALSHLLAWADERSLPVVLLGGGSNLVVEGDVEALVLRLCITGRVWTDVSDSGATLVLGAGERWHEVVCYVASLGYRGIENLALIPGSVGAAPVQNIGAYGMELKDSLQWVDVWDRQASAVRRLSADDCDFAYRHSRFKVDSGRFVILHVALRLSRQRPFVLDYRELSVHPLAQAPADELTPRHLVEAVTQIRRAKLPDPDETPNAGSFFKNPVVEPAVAERLRAVYPDMVMYPDAAGCKLAAAWLIDRCGWKGFREGSVGVHTQQALVLVHYGGGTGAQLMALAQRIADSVAMRFGVNLEMEPQRLGAP
ncbi:MAG: UDP-N-acetylmuramate dehydrogenase [Gammaproteobacteria bacterium]|nr:UDP-N-acetylmuramate dehydrogenase [Gammaproteobacteria bacterium]